MNLKQMLNKRRAPVQPWKYDRDKAVLLPPGCNPYGFKINIHNPRVKELYYRFMKWKGLNVNYPISDRQRLEFESYVLEVIKKNTPGID